MGQQHGVFALFSFCAMLMAAGGTAVADTAPGTLVTQAAHMDELALTQPTYRVVKKFAAEFARFAGSQENAEAILIGLVNATPMVLSGTREVVQDGKARLLVTTDTLLPAGTPMRFGEAFIAVCLARARLEKGGIAKPTPRQVQMALFGMSTGGANEVDSTQPSAGILARHASGMSWEELARTDGLALAPIQQAMRAAGQALTDGARPSQPPAFATTRNAAGKS